MTLFLQASLFLSESRGVLIFAIKPKPHQLNKIEAEQKKKQKQDVMELEDRAYLDARGVPLDNYFNAEVLAKFRAGPDDKSEVLDKLEDILAYNKIKEGEKNQDVKDVLDESEFEKPPNEFEMVFHNGVIGKGDKEKMKSELESEVEEKKKPDKTIYNTNKEKKLPEKKPPNETVFGANKEKAGKAK